MNKYKETPITLTISSVNGNALQTPAMPPVEDNNNAMGIIIKNPRKTEIMWAGRAYSVEVKYMDNIILNPANRQAVK